MNRMSSVGFEDCIGRLRRNDPALALTLIPTGISAFWGESLGWPAWLVAGTDLAPGEPLPRRIRLCDDLRIFANLLERHGEARLGAMMLEWPRYPAESQVLAAPDLGSALYYAVEGTDRANPPVTAWIERSEGLALCRFATDPVLGPFRGAYEQVLLIWMFLIARSFLGMTRKGREQLSRIVIARCHSDDAIDALLPCTPLRGAQGAYVAMPEELLGSRGPGFDPALWESIVGSTEPAAADGDAAAAALFDEIGRLVASALTKQARVPQFSEIARALGPSERTLARKLAGAGKTYRGVVDEVRMTMARDCLMQERTRVQEIARQLGYSEDSAFIRAFRSHFGVSPAKWRQSMRRQGDRADGAAGMGE